MDEQDHGQDLMAGILGFGLDAREGEVRITRGDGFSLRLGSEDAHEAMLDLCLLIERRLAERGLSLRGVSRDCFEEVLAEIAAELPSVTYSRGGQA